MPYSTRRDFLSQSTGWLAGAALGPALLSSFARAKDEKLATAAMVRTVLGPVAPEKLGVALMHEHAPVIDWAELYEVMRGPIEPIREQMLANAAGQLQKFHETLGKSGDVLAGSGAIVECTPIRVGRYPELIRDLAQKTPVHIIACTGFWTEGPAPQHPWAVKMSVADDGVKQIADLYIREITQGMEDPSGEWGERFTDIKAGVIKCATSEFMRPSERRCHLAASIASKETGCPITTHTSSGGGLEQAQLFLKAGVAPEKIMIGHQGHQDDRKSDEPLEYHRLIASLGCYVQFDRVGLSRYKPDKVARQIRDLVDSGHVRQVLVGHDIVPYFYEDFAAVEKTADQWTYKEPDYTLCTTGLVDALRKAGLSDGDLHTIYVENPARVLAF